jgi:hypothetical protein
MFMPVSKGELAMPERKEWSPARDVLFVLLNAGLVALLVPLPALALFFGVSWALVGLRQLTEDKPWQSVTCGVAVVILVLLL